MKLVAQQKGADDTVGQRQHHRDRRNHLPVAEAARGAYLEGALEHQERADQQHAYPTLHSQGEEAALLYHAEYAKHQGCRQHQQGSPPGSAAALQQALGEQQHQDAGCDQDKAGHLVVVAGGCQAVRRHHQINNERQEQKPREPDQERDPEPVIVADLRQHLQSCAGLLAGGTQRVLGIGCDQNPDTRRQVLGVLGAGA